MKKVLYSILLVVFGVGGWFLGMWCQKFLYIDTCMDIGGAMNDSDYSSICVIETQRVDTNPTREDGVYFCDEKGNKFISKEEARKHGLQDSEFGATFCQEF